MSLLKKLAILALFLLPTGAFASFGGAVSPRPYVITEIFGLPVTNAMLTTWAISITLIIVVRLMIGKVSIVPTHGQAVIEHMIEGIRGVLEPVVGKKMIDKTFPLLIGFFAVILINNWSGLLPGVGTFGHWEAQTEIAAEDVAAYEAEGGHVIEIDGKDYTASLKYYFRPANASLSNTLALSVVSFIAWLWFIFRYAGPKVIAYDLFGNKADAKEVPKVMYVFLAIIFFLVGFIEIVSILFRPVSLSFRLFGNVFGGENLLSNMHGMAAYVLPVPFYLLEVLIGLIQAFVFTLLVAVYIGLICNHDDGHGEEAHH
ncbi:F0F1 ATP synthase subunit A [Rubellicoccus peritrichatus]|uniref:ATP synthase subunit a n=1 Tax=Rubellicoccus peritrichatus TaxID=3080537 RepID=A0AAQ3LD38_9BACT|nr:F0F1 ATP synthase subunit A [Puniceicoccus sp. CR14]WOO42277.1 F0F1 ATP synthase subunit A [Puniceicoccus sp. CR14]